MRLGKTIPVSGAPGFEVSAEIPGGLFIKGSLSSSGKDRIVRGILRPYGSLMTSKFLPEAVRKRIKGRVAVLSVDESPIPFLLSRARQWMVILSSGLSAGALTLLWFSLLNRKRVLPRAPQLLRRLCWLMGAVGVAWSVYLSLRYRPTVSDTSILVLGAVVSSLLIAELALSRFPPAATSNV